MATKSQFRLKGKSKDSYMELVLDFPLASIKNDEHLQEAQKVLDALLARGALNEGEETYLDALSDLVGAYEDEHHAIEPAFDAEMLQHLLDAIGKPDTAEKDGKIETLLEQLRIRQLSTEQLETFERQKFAAEKLRALHEAAVLMRKIGSFGDPRLYALSRVAESLSQSTQPLVPERVFVAGGGSTGEGQQAGQGLLGVLIELLVAEKSGFLVTENTETAKLQQFAERMETQALESMSKNGQELPTTA